MRTTRMVAVVALVAAVAYAVQWSGAPVQASDSVSVSSAVVMAVVAGDAGHEYKGTKSCKKCHIATYKSWAKTPHAKALDALKPGNATEEKEKHELDPTKDYSTDAKCLGCHTVGYDKPGGYVVPDPEDKKAVKFAAKRAGVGCEACHGPGSGFAAIKKVIKKEKRKYKLSELTDKGLVIPTADTCTRCHTEGHPTYDAENKFDFEKMSKTGLHEKQGLKLRED